MVCVATGGGALVCVSTRTPEGGIGCFLTTFRPTRADSHAPALLVANGKCSAVVSIAACCVTGSGPDSVDRVASGSGFLIFWITNLWRGERRDDSTLNRAPLIAHLNSTSLSSIVSGKNHW